MPDDRTYLGLPPAPAAANSSTARDQIERLAGVARHSLRFLLPALGVFVVGVGATALYDHFRPRSYHSEALLVYREGTRWSALGGGETRDTSQKLGLLLKQTLLSRTRLAPIATDFKLYEELRDPVDEMRLHVQFRPSGEAFTVGYDGPTPEVAQGVVARLARIIVEEADEVERGQTQVTRDFLDGEKKRSQAELQRLEKTLAEFIAKNPQFAQHSGGAGEGAMLAAAAPAGSRGGGGGGAGKKRLRRRAGGRGPEAPPPSLSPKNQAHWNDLMRQREGATQEVEAARRELTDRRAQFTERHPDVLVAMRKFDAAEAKLRDINDELQEMSDAQDAALGAPAVAPAPSEDGGGEPVRAAGAAASEGKRRRAAGPAAAATPEAAHAPVGVNAVVSLMTDWTRLNRELAEGQERYQQIETRLFRASMLVSATNAHVAIVDPPFLPVHPRPPTRRTVFVLGGAASVGFALVLALGLAFFDDRLQGRQHLAASGVGPLLAAIPRVDASSALAGLVAATRPLKSRGGPSKNARLALRAAPETPEAAGYRILRYRLARLGNPRIIAVTGAEAGDGSSEVAANLALAIAEHGHDRVLLVDARARGSRLAVLFGSPATNPATEATIGPADARLRLWPADTQRGATSLRVAALASGGANDGLDGTALARGLRALSSATFDYVIIDAPAVLGSADVNLLATGADGILFAARVGDSSASALRRAVDQLAPERILGVVLLDA